MNPPSQPSPGKPDVTPTHPRPRLPAVALVTSVAAHAGLFLTLANAEPPFTPRLPHPPPTLVQLSPPQPEPEPEPPPPEPEPPPPEVAPEPAPQQAKPPPPTRQAPRAAEAEPTPEQPSSPVAPIALTGLTLSNVGFSVPAGSPGPSGPTRASAPALPGVKSPPAPKPSPPALVPLRDLSSKPKPPSLDAALRRHYPAALRSRGIEGQALVRLTLAPAGTVRSVSVLSESEPGFGAACKKTVTDSRWSAPLDQTGKPVGTQLTYRCRFRVQ